MVSDDVKLSLDELLEVHKQCMKRNDSKCNFCQLNGLYGEDCIELKNKISVKYLKELKQLREVKKFKNKTYSEGTKNE